jgi:hypothetical protein
MAGWAAFWLATHLAWAMHLKALTGWSALPNYWGELLTARDLWEVMENGGLRSHPAGPWTLLAAGGGLLWFLWAGWRLQAACAGLPARLGAWVWGLVDALLIGAVPLGLLAGALMALFGWLGATGIRGLGWLDWVGGGLVRLAFWSALFLQWWLCRLDRAQGPDGFRLGSRGRLAAHLGLCFRRFWGHAAQWLALVVGGVVVRAGLTLAVLALAWRLGGGTLPKLFAFVVLELLVVAANAWQIGWFLRLTALFAAGRNDSRA